MKKFVLGIRLALFAFAAVIIVIAVPVPSARTPQASMSLNTQCNRVSAVITAFFANGSAMRQDAHVWREGDIVFVDSGALRNRLVYTCDNIVALGVCVFFILLAYGIFVELFRIDLRGIVLGWISWIAVFGVMFVVRAIVYGVFVVNIHVSSFVPLTDNPFRLLMIFVPTAVAMLVQAKITGTRHMQGRAS